MAESPVDTALAEALRRIRENAQAWHGPPGDAGYERALSVIATWCSEALALAARPTTSGDA